VGEGVALPTPYDGYCVLLTLVTIRF